MKEEAVERRCCLCENVAKVRCNMCNQVLYCSLACQKDHWKVHKKDCQVNLPRIASGSSPSASSKDVMRSTQIGVPSALGTDDEREEARSKNEIAVYKPWPEDVIYVPGVGDAPPLKPRLKYGEVPEVGDIPRIGARDGDPRCQDRFGYRPCQTCVYEVASKQQYPCKVMPSLDQAEFERRNPFTGMRHIHSHPSTGPTPAMNTGRGCDKYGVPYLPPPRYLYLDIHRFSDEFDDYEKTKTYELDYGPEIDSEEFREGLRTWKESEDFSEYGKKMKDQNPDWEWKDPVEEKPWAQCQRVDPNPWLTDDYVVKDPIQQHVERVRKWAAEEHEPWPS